MAFIAYAAVFFSMCICIFQIPQRVLLIRNGAVAPGVVVSAQPANHYSITVTYTVLGETYTRTAAGYPLQPSDKISVYYLPRNPSTALFENPATDIGRDIVGCLVWAMIVSGAVVWFTRRARPLFILFAPFPRTLSIVLTLGTIMGLTFSFLSGVSYLQIWIGGVLAVSGCVLLLIRAFALPYQTGWRTFLVSRVAASALVLIIIANILQLA